MPPPSKHACCIVWGAADDNTGIRMCPHCLRRTGEPWDEPDGDLLVRQVEQSRATHVRLCKVGTTRQGTPWQKGWKNRR